MKTKKIFEYKFVIFSMIFSFVIGIFSIAKESFWVDEISSIYISRNLSDLFDLMIHKENNMWLYYTILHFWLMISDSEIWVRILSLLPFVFTIPFLFLLNTGLFNKKVAQISVLLFAINTFMLFYAQEARSYSLFVFFTVVSTYYWIKTLKNYKKYNWLLWMLFTVLMLYSHLIGIFYFATEIFLSVVYPGKKKYALLLKTCIAVFVALIPTMIFSKQIVSGLLNWIPKTTFGTLGSLLFDFSSGSNLILSIYVLLLLYLAFSYSKEYLKKGYIKSSWPLVAYVCLFIFPIMIVFVESMIFKPRFLNRYFIMCLPIYLTLVAVALTKIKYDVARIGLYVLIALFSVVSVINYTEINKKDDWRDSVRIIESNVAAGDSVVLYPEFLNDSFNFYNNKYLEKNKLQVYDFLYQSPNGAGAENISPSNEVLLKDIMQNHKRIWYISGHLISEQRMQLSKKIKETFSSKKYIVKSEYEQPTDIAIYLYERK